MSAAGCSGRHELAENIATAQRFAESALEATKRRGMAPDAAQAIADVAHNLGSVAGTLLGAAEGLRLMVSDTLGPEDANAAWLTGLIQDSLEHQAESLARFEERLLSLVNGCPAGPASVEATP